MLNKVMLIGNLGADPEVRYMPSGDAVTNISVATSRRWKDKQTGQPREETEWHRITFFNIGNYRLAEIAGEYLKKGSKVYVEGRLKTSKYQKNGQDHYSTDIVADQMQMLDPKGGDTTFESQGQAGYNAPQTNQAQQQPQEAQQFNQAQTAQQPPVQQFNQAAQQPPVQPFNQAAQQPPVQQPAQQYTPPPVQQPFNQAQQAAVVEQPIPPTQQQPPVQQPFNQQPAAQQAPVQNPASAPVNDDFDDDIPF